MNEITSQVPLNPPLSETPSVAAHPAPQSSPAERSLRLWPGVVLVALLWLGLKVPGWVAPGTMAQFIGMFWGPMLGAVALACWWLFASRLRWADRWLGLVACAAVGVTAFFLGHSSFGLMGLIVYSLPMAMTVWVLWLLVTPFLPWPARRAGLLVVFVLAWGYFALVRMNGVDGSFAAEFQYRWLPTAEEKFLAEIATTRTGREPSAVAPSAQPLALAPGDWPSFRGPNRDSLRPGVRIADDWRAYPPRLLWRHRVGPGWSSFAVVGIRLYTQEQRGEEELVICYDADTGAELWSHRDATRFAEVVSGPGPRATPTFHESKIYALGASGKLNCLDAATGRPLWSRDIAADSGAKVPTWGFSASPLIVEGVVTVFAGGPDGKSVLGYRADSGELAWSAGMGQLSYCSTQRARLCGAEQLLIVAENGLTAFSPANGKLLWQHDWLLPEVARVVQPTVLDDTDVLIGTGFRNGTRRVRVSQGGNGWTTQEVWTTLAINPYYNDLVVHRGHLYGFDSNFFKCVSLDGGKEKWRARGYGNGQVLLLPDQDLLLVLSEKGEAALVEASPDGHRERGRFQAIESKTWNHPVVAHGKLFVRNGEEAACYLLAEATGAERTVGDEGPKSR